MNHGQVVPLASLLLFALLANLPLGYLRMSSRKYSVRWFVYIHLSIPFIVFLRLHFGFGWTIIPLTLGCAVLGQLIGARMKGKAGT